MLGVHDSTACLLQGCGLACHLLPTNRQKLVVTGTDVIHKDTRLQDVPAAQDRWRVSLRLRLARSGPLAQRRKPGCAPCVPQCPASPGCSPVLKKGVSPSWKVPRGQLRRVRVRLDQLKVSVQSRPAEVVHASSDQITEVRLRLDQLRGCVRGWTSCKGTCEVSAV